MSAQAQEAVEWPFIGLRLYLSKQPRDGQVTSGDLMKVLKAFLNREKDAVMRILRDLEEAGFISQAPNEDRGTVYHWQLRDMSVRCKLDRVADLLEKIDKVVALQRANPENEEAGKELLLDDIYYNVVSRRKAFRAGSAQS
jgi:DNA-binding MarR family transcriptional regulator